MTQRFSFTAELWLWPGDAGWHFVTVPAELSDDIANQQTGPRRGFGSVRVEVTIGTSTWSTSVFPDSGLGAYVLPVKKPVRTKEGLVDGATVDVGLVVL